MRKSRTQKALEVAEAYNRRKRADEFKKVRSSVKITPAPEEVSKDGGR